MPCNNVSDIIDIVLDNEERLVSYCLTKQTCGRSVGDTSMLLSQLKGKTFSSLLLLEAHDVCPEEDYTDVDEFFIVKHLTALKSAFLAYSGRIPSDALHPDVLSVSSFGDRTAFSVALFLDIAPTKIRPCGNCHGCKNSCGG